MVLMLLRAFKWGEFKVLTGATRSYFHSVWHPMQTFINYLQMSMTRLNLLTICMWIWVYVNFLTFYHCLWSAPVFTMRIFIFEKSLQVSVCVLNQSYIVISNNVMSNNVNVLSSYRSTAGLVQKQIYIQTHIWTYGQFRAYSSPYLHVFQLCEETPPRGNPHRWTC